jgi:hypothetical protein
VTRIVLVSILGLCAVTAGAADAGRPGRWDVVVSGANAPAVSQELGVARTADGSLHVAWREGFNAVRARTISAAGALGAASTVVAGWDLGADPTLIASAGVRAFFAGVTPVEGLNTSTAPAASSAWSAPALVDDREFARGRTAGAAVLPSGVPLLTWYSAGDIVVRSGVTPGAPLYTLTAGGSNTRPNVAADAAGNALVAWCEFTGGTRGVFVQRVGANGAPAGGAVKLPGSTTNDATGIPQAACVLESTVSRREPIVARAGGGFFVAGTSGYPALNRVLVWRLDASGAVSGSIVVATSTTSGFSEPAVAAAPDGRVWAAWLESAGGGRRIVARRSNLAGTVFGAPVRAMPPGGLVTGTVNLDAQRDRVDVLAIAQSTSGEKSVQHTQLLPGLTIVRTSLVRRRGSASVTFRVLDAGDPVAGARVRAAGRSGVTNARGSVTLVVRRGGTATATRAGYVAASTRFACCR